MEARTVRAVVIPRPAPHIEITVGMARVGAGG